MLSDIVEDYAAGRPDKSVAGLITSMLNLKLKVAASVANLIIGAVLAFVGLEHKIAAGIDRVAVERLGLTYVSVVAILDVLCIAIFHFYPIPDQKWQRKR